MMNHRRRQHFLGERQKFLGERSGHHRRVLDEIRHFLEQGRVQHRRVADAAAKAARLRFEAARDAILALLTIENDEMFAEPRGVVVEGAHLHRAPCPAARRQKAVAVGHRSRHNFLHRGRLGQLRAPNRERHDASAVEIENPANRTPEQQIALSVLEIRVPVHGLGKTERSQRRRQHVGQHINRRLAALMLANPRYVPFGVSTRSSCATSTLFLRAKPAAAGVGVPSAPNAAATGGPVSSSSRSVCRSAIFAMRAVRRRGVL